jgi:hypothetical protein
MEMRQGRQPGHCRQTLQHGPHGNHGADALPAGFLRGGWCDCAICAQMQRRDRIVHPTHVPAGDAMSEHARLKRRIDDAARYAPLEQLALSPQCGFSSTVHGNNIAVEAQRAGLRLVAETAREARG